MHPPCWTTLNWFIQKNSLVNKYLLNLSVRVRAERSASLDGVMDSRGASICEHDLTTPDARDIAFPYQVLPLEHLSVDVGGSLAKVVYFSCNEVAVDKQSRTAPVLDTTETFTESTHSHDLLRSKSSRSPAASGGGRLHFVKFETSRVEDCVQFLKSKLDEGASAHREIVATGGGAFKYQALLREATRAAIVRVDEMTCLIVGLNFLLKEVPNESFILKEDGSMESVTTNRHTIFPYMLVNIGSGVSILRVTSETSFERISGSSLGGGTLWGLLSLLTDCCSFDEMLALSLKGDNKHVDMLVGDIYGTDYTRIGLKASTIASSFGKVFRPKSIQESSPHLAECSTSSIESAEGSCDSSSISRREMRMHKFHQEDMAKSLLFMVSNNIGQIAYLNAQQHHIERIYFGGYFIRNHQDTMRTISFAVNFWSKGQMKAYFLRHEGYLGAVGAFLHSDRTSDLSHAGADSS